MNSEWWSRDGQFGLPDEDEAYVSADAECVAVGVDGESQVLLFSLEDVEAYRTVILAAWKAHERLVQQQLS